MCDKVQFVVVHMYSILFLFIRNKYKDHRVCILTILLQMALDENAIKAVLNPHRLHSLSLFLIIPQIPPVYHNLKNPFHKN